MTFQYPLLLWGIPLAVVCTAGTLLFPTYRLSLRTALLALLRCLTLTALILSFASPASISDRPSDSLITFIDISDSIPEEMGEATLQMAKDLAQSLTIPLEVIPFGKTTSRTPIAPPTTFRDLRTTWQQLDIGGTNIERALGRGTSLGSQAILLASDGWETQGVVQNALIDGSALRVFPLTSSNSVEGNAKSISISQLSAPLVAKSQKSVDIRVSLNNPTATSQPAVLTVMHGKNQLTSRQITLNPAQEEILIIQSDPSQEGLNEITAELSYQDSTGSHSSTKTVWLSGEKRNKILIINGTPDDGRLLPTILKNQAYAVHSWTVGESDSAVGELTDYEAVVLNNVPRTSLPRRIENALPGFVRRGGGFIMVGGNRSFGLGGYIDSEIEGILPVRLIPPTTEKKRINVAVQLVIDKSRSMATDNRLDFAKEAASQVVRNLKDDDYIGVIGFDETPFVAQPISLVGQVRDMVVDRVNRLFPARRTELFPAIDEARRGLIRVEAGRKHMIILTDGKIPDAGEYYLQLVRQMKPLGITLSTILVGGENDDGFLSNLASLGGGKFYVESDPRNLPSIFLSDVRVATGERTMRESSMFAIRPGPSDIVSTALREFPIVRGVVETMRRDGAQTELIAVSDQKSSPLLASMTIGSGKSVAFTSDANGRWSSEWMRWSGIAEFWTDLLDAVRPSSGEQKKNYNFDLRSWVERGEVVLDLSLFDDPLGQLVTGTIDMPSGATKDVTFTSTQPGHYLARIPEGLAGKYLAKLRVGSTQLPEVAWSLSGDLFGEQKRKTPHMKLLQELAFKTGGKINPSNEDLAQYIRSATSVNSLSLPLLLLALLLFGIEIVTREITRKLRL